MVNHAPDYGPIRGLDCFRSAIGTRRRARGFRLSIQGRRIRSMNWDQIEGKWSQVKGQVRQQFARLTDDDLAMVHGKRELLLGKIQERYGYAKEEAQRQLDAWAKTIH
jgi:uncharacterized protein YjbJ (UPF0337 family)